MPEFILSDEAFEQGQVLQKQAFEILNDTANLTAERYELAERLQNGATEQFKSSESLREIEAKRQQAQVAFKNADENKEQEEEKSSEYQSVGHWAKAVYHLKHSKIITGPGLQWWDGDSVDGKARVHHIKESKALAENVGATGGFLVPAEFQSRVLNVAMEQTIVRPRAEIIRMNRRTVSIPALEQEGVVAGGFSWFGGIKTYYAEEGGQRQASQPAFRQVTLTAHALTGYTSSSIELLDDSAVSLQDWLLSNRGFPGALAHQADYDYLRGDGVGKPSGIVGHASTIVIARATASRVTYEDLTQMLSSALPNTNLLWVASQSVMNELLIMNGPSGNPSYLWGSAISGAPASLLGRPIVFTDKLPPLGTEGDIILVDLGYYLIGDRQAITMDMSVDELFRNNQVSWRAIMRHDGKPWLNAPISYGRGTEIGTLSPFVALGDAAT